MLLVPFQAFVDLIICKILHSTWQAVWLAYSPPHPASFGIVRPIRQTDQGSRLPIVLAVGSTYMSTRDFGQGNLFSCQQRRAKIRMMPQNIGRHDSSMPTKL